MNAYNPGDAQNLLIEAGSIIHKHEAISRETGYSFNIFEIAGIGAAEDKVCLVLRELLLPTGSHGHGSKYLEIFLQDCLGLSFISSELDKAKVHREYHADGRRIDIVIEVGIRFIPIEVKVSSSEGEVQCYDYYQYAKKRDNQARVVYLTKFGDAPESSAEKLTKAGDEYEEVIQLSFAKDILGWLYKCLALPGTIKKASVREVIIQFAATMEKFTDKLGDKPMDEITKLLMKTPENLQNAMTIASTLKDLESRRPEMIKKFLAAVEGAIGDKRLKRALGMSGDYLENDCVKKFKAPGINYIVGTAEGADILFRIEIDWHGELFAGYCLARDGERFGDEELVSSNKVKRLFREIDECEPSEWWIYWEFTMFNDDKVNFKHFNENYYRLFDSGMFDQIVASTVAHANDMLDKLKMK